MAGGVNVTFGGDPSNYMDPPSGQLTGLLSDLMPGANLISSLFDALGLNKQVAKEAPAAEPKEAKESETKQSTDSKAKSSDGGAKVPAILNEVESMLTPSGPASEWGGRWMESIKPITMIDPNQGF